MGEQGRMDLWDLQAAQDTGRPAVWRHWQLTPRRLLPAELRGQDFFQVEIGLEGSWTIGRRNKRMPQPDDGGLVSLLRNLGGSQSNDAGWPIFNGNYVT